MIRRLGILAHPRRPESRPVARQIAAETDAQGVRVWFRESWTAPEIRELLNETDVLVTIGGDGAMLQAARLCAPVGVPVLGINMGYLGFLTETSLEGWAACLARMREGQYWLEKRLMIRGEVYRNGQRLLQEDSLNDIVISRGALARTVHLEVYIDDGWATNYSADGLILATATGSTAYALAAGGPILPPELDNILMVPVAAHLSMDRPVVLSQGAHVKVTISARTEADTLLAMDGGEGTALQLGDEVHIRASENRSLFLRVQGRNYFFRSLLDRLEPRFQSKHPPQEAL